MVELAITCIIFKAIIDLLLSCCISSLEHNSGNLRVRWEVILPNITQPAIKCSRTTIEAPETGVKYVQSLQ